MNIHQILNKPENLVILAGAGCSMDPPSCLPNANDVKKLLFDRVCLKTEVKTLVTHKNMRFEQMIETFSGLMDPEMDLLDYYGKSEDPNFEHYFLASLAKRGATILTTNFDSLIEQAILHLNVPKDQLRLVITKSDYQDYQSLLESKEDDICAVVKLHGSLKNICTEQDTKLSLKATIKSLVKFKKGDNLFTLEPYKKTPIETTLIGKTLVTIGYSGNDDFDIIPTLKTINTLKRLVWINYRPDITEDKLIEIGGGNDNQESKASKVLSFLTDFKKQNPKTKTYLFNANVSDFCEKQIDMEISKKKTEKHIEFADWLEEYVKKPSLFEKMLLSGFYYSDMGEYEQSIQILTKLHNLARKQNNREWIRTAMTHLSKLYHQVEYYKDERILLAELFASNLEENNYIGIASNLTQIGSIFYYLMQYKYAINYFEHALDIYGVLKSKIDLAVPEAECLLGLGAVYKDMGDNEAALNTFKCALDIFEYKGIIEGIGPTVHNIGVIYDELDDLENALDYYKKALMIGIESGNNILVLNSYIDMGALFMQKQDIKSARKSFLKAKEIADKYNLPREMIIVDANLRTLDKPELIKELLKQKQSIRKEETKDSFNKEKILRDLGFEDETIEILNKRIREYNLEEINAVESGDYTWIYICLAALASMHGESMQTYPFLLKALKVYDIADNTIDVLEYVEDICNKYRQYKMVNVAIIAHKKALNILTNHEYPNKKLKDTLEEKLNKLLENYRKH
ncbi:MAG: tetratricopeptide repeat protein [Candidatus Lokiarchaeota archaeon]|nr:tetratricopeptide repeat protein [Candidatus Lokiarchaeota archaeon]